MATTSPLRQPFFLRSISFKNILLFLLILLGAVGFLTLRYYEDSRDYEIQNLASKLEFFAERGASWINATDLPGLTRSEHMQTPAYRNLVRTLNRIEREFEVDNAILMRRSTDGQYTFIASGNGEASGVQQGDKAIRNPCSTTVAIGNTVRNPCNPAVVTTGALRNPCNPAVLRNPCNPAVALRNPCNPAVLRNPCNPTVALRNPCNPAVLRNPCNPAVLRNPCNPAVLSDSTVKNPCTASRPGGFAIGQSVHIHAWFPATYKATEDTWQQGKMMHSQPFGGPVVDEGLPNLVLQLCQLFTGLNETRLWQRFCSPSGTDYDFDQFLQINTPLKVNGNVTAILMLNKFANPVVAAVRAKTFRVLGLTGVILVVGLGLFGYSSARMLRPLKNLTIAAGEVAQGNLDITLPAPRSQDEVGRLSTTFNTMLGGLRQRDFIRDTFGRYLSKEVVEEVLDSPDGLKMGGEMREITILVSDLRGFTSLAARLSPDQVIDILNRYLEGMVDVIAKYRGTVDEFQGDGILAFFGAPLAAKDDQERAVACAIEMQNALVEINAEQHRRQLPELKMGIGINTGAVIIGNIGSEKRTKYGAVGSAINEAYRIESYTVGGQLLISPSVYDPLRHLVQIRSTQEVQFKGLSETVSLYDVARLQGQYACALPEKAPETFVTLATPLPVACFLVEGKTVSDVAILGTIRRLSESAAEASLEGSVAVYSNVKLCLTPSQEAELPEVYAKVLALTPDAAPASSTQACLEFTSLPETAKTFLEHQRATALQDKPAQAS